MQQEQVNPCPGWAAWEGHLSSPAMARQVPQGRKSLGAHQGEGAAFCSAYCVNFAGPLGFAFFQLSDIKGIKALAAGTRPMVWAKLQTSEIINCGKQEKE